MEQNPKIALVGYGYWGKILHKSLKEIGYEDIQIFDDVLGNTESLDENFSHYLIATPFQTHQEIIQKICGYRDKWIWCEKPLVSTLDQASFLYELTGKTGNHLFVDWIYNYNPAIDFIQSYLNGKKVKQILLNRTNNGPVRTDCKSYWDLSSHDLTILLKILGINYPFKFKWNEFSLKTNENFGSNLSWHYSDGIQIIVNSSWQHTSKNRVILFILEDDSIIVFNDQNKTIIIDGKEVKNYTNYPPPLHTALNIFFSGETSEYEENKDLTLRITSLLQTKTKKIV
jgi:predicted dehydrogenase